MKFSIDECFLESFISIFQEDGASQFRPPNGMSSGRLNWGHGTILFSQPNNGKIEIGCTEQLNIKDISDRYALTMQNYGHQILENAQENDQKDN